MATCNCGWANELNLLNYVEVRNWEYTPSRSRILGNDHTLSYDTGPILLSLKYGCRTATRTNLFGARDNKQLEVTIPPIDVVIAIQ